ncbi:MAG: hypothetical protein QOJ38_1433 [Solirubrobacterales bacterium]|jgi:predicted lipoprotein with Yx(FWY)xxD motif|nr:hypothetical protein [Solirubrobacterales bacterium]
MQRLLILVVALGGLLAGGCGSGNSGGPSSAPTVKPPVQTITDPKGAFSGRNVVRHGTTVKIGPTNLGRILVDRVNKPLYLFTRDGKGPSRCYGECALAWPPLLTRRPPRAVAGAKSALLGTSRRSDGALQVTYDGQPVYYYRGDPPGIVRCQGVAEFGGTWYVVKASGTALRS